MAAPPSQFLLLICGGIFFFLATFSGAGNTPQAYSDTTNVISTGPIAGAPSPGGGGGGGGEEDGSKFLDEQSTSFQSVPRVKDTPAVNMFVQSTMQKSMVKTENFIDDVILKRLNDPATDEETKGCLSTCKEAYTASISAMKKTVEDVNHGNLYKANIDVTAMSSDADTCKDCMQKVYDSDDPQFKKFEAWINGVTDDCLTKITGIKGT